MADLDGIDELARAIGQSVSWVVSSSSSWWLDAPTNELGQGQVDQLRNLLIPLAIILATAGVMWQGIRMILTRKSAPLVDVGRGLWSVAGWGAIGTLAPLVALRAGDEFSTWVLGQATGADKMAIQERLVGAFSVAQIPAPGAVVILGIVVMISVFAQTLLLLLRELAVLLIAVVLQAAAASTLARPSSRGVTRLLGWAAALVMYKPLVALIYSMAFLIIGPPGVPSTRPFFVVTAALLLSLVAFPAALRFFQKSVRSLDGGWDMRPKRSAAGVDARAMHALSGSGGPAGAHARYLSQSMHAPAPGGATLQSRMGGVGPTSQQNRMLPSWLTQAPITNGAGPPGTSSPEQGMPKSSPPEMEPSPATAEASAQSPPPDDEGRRG